MLFEKLVEQHRVHRFVANGVRLALFVASHQIGIYFFHLLGHQAELRDAVGIKSCLYRNVTGFSARIASLALSIGLIASLKRSEETTVPR